MALPHIVTGRQEISAYCFARSLTCSLGRTPLAWTKENAPPTHGAGGARSAPADLRQRVAVDAGRLRPPHDPVDGGRDVADLDQVRVGGPRRLHQAAAGRRLEQQGYPRRLQPAVRARQPELDLLGDIDAEAQAHVVDPARQRVAVRDYLVVVDREHEEIGPHLSVGRGVGVVDPVLGVELARHDLA